MFPLRCVIAVALCLAASCGNGSVAAPAEGERLFREAYDVMPTDRTRGLELFDQSCDRGHAPACQALGVFSRTNADRARYMEAACRRGDYDSCSSAARHLFDQVGELLGADGASHWTRSRHKQQIAELLGKRRQVLELGCERIEGDDGQACDELARAWEAGIGGDIDADKARAFRHKACQRRGGRGCPE